jgi:hypothetical protein
MWVVWVSVRVKNFPHSCPDVVPAMYTVLCMYECANVLEFLLERKV